jgi:hypothetical protein
VKDDAGTSPLAHEIDDTKSPTSLKEEADMSHLADEIDRAESPTNVKDNAETSPLADEINQSESTTSLSENQNFHLFDESNQVELWSSQREDESSIRSAKVEQTKFLTNVKGET